MHGRELDKADRNGVPPSVTRRGSRHLVCFATPRSRDRSRSRIDSIPSCGEPGGAGAIELARPHGFEVAETAKRSDRSLPPDRGPMLSLGKIYKRPYTATQAESDTGSVPVGSIALFRGRRARAAASFAAFRAKRLQRAGLRGEGEARREWIPCPREGTAAAHPFIAKKGWISRGSLRAALLLTGRHGAAGANRRP